MLPPWPGSPVLFHTARENVFDARATQQGGVFSLTPTGFPEQVCGEDHQGKKSIYLWCLMSHRTDPEYKNKLHPSSGFLPLFKQIQLLSF